MEKPLGLTNEFLGVYFFMAVKGQKFKTYSEELKMEAIRLQLEGKWTYRQINDHLGIQDQGQGV